MVNSNHQRAVLARQKCVPCEGNVPALAGDELARLKGELGPGWRLEDARHLERTYKFSNFRQALDFTDQVGELAESEGHHPEICLGWGKVKITLWTHAAKGLTKNDFILAAKIDELEGR